MKKLLVGFCLFNSAVFAQDSKFLIGANAAGIWNSYSLANQKNSPYLFQGKINWSAGIQSKYLLSKKFRVDAQINFGSKNFGSGITYLNTMAQFHWSVRQNYLEIPVSLNYSILSDNPVNFFCSLGFTNSFFLSAKYPNGNPTYNSNGEVMERYKNYLISVRPGLGILFPMGKSFYGSAECYGNIYAENAYNNSSIHGNPFQLALGFSVLKKLGKGTIN